MADRAVRLKVNGNWTEVRATPDRPLLGILREELGLTGTKYGCGEGECGACMVLADGAPVNSCQLPLSEVGSREIVTVEGLAGNGELSAVQRAFVEAGAFQCGYCTPGMIVRATALLEVNPDPTRDEIEEALERNICRCCGYGRILAAVERAATLAREGKGSA